MRFRPLFRLAAATLLVPVIASAQITVLLSGGIRAAYDKLLPEFEKSTGIAVTFPCKPDRHARAIVVAGHAV